jgi:hypothetical protein
VNLVPVEAAALACRDGAPVAPACVRIGVPLALGLVTGLGCDRCSVWGNFGATRPSEIRRDGLAEVHPSLAQRSRNQDRARPTETVGGLKIGWPWAVGRDAKKPTRGYWRSEGNRQLEQTPLAKHPKASPKQGPASRQRERPAPPRLIDGRHRFDDRRGHIVSGVRVASGS